jgi:lipid-binding SYLF domain-containing protein
MEETMSRTRAVSVALSCLVLGCASAPKTTAQRDVLRNDADNTLATMTANDPSLRPLLDSAAAYVVFPEIKQGGFVVGGAGGRGVLYQNGMVVGYAEMSQASVGAQIGGQKYAELIVLRDQAALDRLRASNFDFGGQVSAVAIRAGAAATSNFSSSGVAVFTKPKGGAMLNVSLTGQKIRLTG